MRPRSLLVLFLLVAGLLAFIWFYERDLPSTEERVELAKRVMRLEADEVTELEISRGGQTVRLERQPPAAASTEESSATGWRLTEPLAARADAAEVESLVDRLVGLEKSRTLEEVDAAALGLGTPRATVAVQSAAGVEVLEIGSAIPASSNMVVRVGGGSEAYVVSAAVWDDLQREAGEWRSREVFAAGSDEIRAVRLQTAADAVRLARAESGFRIEEPLADVADEDLVDALLTTLSALEVEEFVNGEALLDPVALGLEPPQSVVELELDAGTTRRLELGAPLAEDAKLRYGRFEGQLATLADDLEEDLARAPGDWRSKAWTSFDVWQVESFEVVGDDGEVTVVREGGDWLRAGEKIPYSPVSDFLYALTGVMADELEPVIAGGEPLLTIRLFGESSDEALSLFPEADGRHLATTAGRDVGLVLSAATVDDLRMKLAELRDAEPESAADAPEESG